VGDRAKVWPRRVASITCVAVVVACSLPKLPALSDGGVALPSCGSGSGICLALLAGGIGGPGNVDGTGSAARFQDPKGMAVDAAGNIYVADFGNDVIRKITPAGVVTTFAGMTGVAGSADGTGSAAQFGGAFALAADAAGNFWVADYLDTIREVTPDGTVTTIAGVAGMEGSADGTGSAALFAVPEGIAVDGSGNIWVADTANYVIRMVTPAGVVTTVAGRAGATGITDGTGSAARFEFPTNLAVDPSGNIYISDTQAATIRKMTPQGDVSTFAGLGGVTGSTDGVGSAARFSSPYGLAFDAAGNLFVADANNWAVRKITPSGLVSTFVGTAAAPGSADGTGSAARFDSPTTIAIDAAGNLYVGDAYAETVRKVTPAGVVTTLAGLAQAEGSADGVGSAALFAAPGGVGVDGAGTVYVADVQNSTIRTIAPSDMVSTLAGSAGITGSADGTGASARFFDPESVAVSGSGVAYVADSENHTIRAVTPQGVVTTLAGLARNAGSADGVGSGARFNLPYDTALDGSGNVYVVDASNTVREITPDGTVTTIAGSPGMAGSSDGTGSAARFHAPHGVTVDAAGNLYVTDAGNYTIRKIAPGGVVTTLAGSAGTYGSADGTGSAALFAGPSGIAVDAAGNLYVCDNPNATIRKITPAGAVTTIAGTAGVKTIKLGTSPGFSYPKRVAIAGDSLVITDSNAVLVLEHALQ